MCGTCNTSKQPAVCCPGVGRPHPCNKLPCLASTIMTYRCTAALRHPVVSSTLQISPHIRICCIGGACMHAKNNQPAHQPNDTNSLHTSRIIPTRHALLVPDHPSHNCKREAPNKPADHVSCNLRAHVSHEQTSTLNRMKQHTYVLDVGLCLHRQTCTLRTNQ